MKIGSHEWEDQTHTRIYKGKINRTEYFIGTLKCKPFVFTKDGLIINEERHRKPMVCKQENMDVVEYIDGEENV